MDKWTASSRFRRLLAHLSTPLLAALLAGFLFRDSDTPFVESVGIFLFGAYFVWLMVGLPVALMSRRKPRKIWTYLAYAGVIVGLPVLALLPIRSLADFGQSMSYVTIAVTAGIWYWFCADWQPKAREIQVRPD